VERGIDMIEEGDGVCALSDGKEEEGRNELLPFDRFWIFSFALVPSRRIPHSTTSHTAETSPKPFRH